MSSLGWVFHILAKLRHSGDPSWPLFFVVSFGAEWLWLFRWCFGLGGWGAAVIEGVAIPSPWGIAGVRLLLPNQSSVQPGLLPFVCLFVGLLVCWLFGSVPFYWRSCKQESNF